MLRGCARLHCIVVEELAPVSFRFAELVVPFNFSPRVLGGPRLDKLECPMLENPELCTVVVKADAVMEGTLRRLTVEEVLECTSDDTKGLRAMSTSPRLGSTGLGEGSMLMLCTSFGLILALFLVSMLAFENHPGFLLDASCLRIASRFSGSLAERTASASRASCAVRSASALSCAS